jgi:hypothetical protein
MTRFAGRTQVWGKGATPTSPSSDYQVRDCKSFMYCKANYVGLLIPDADA